MDIASVAKQLQGCQYPLRLGKETKSQLRDAGIVIVHGASDDIMSFKGAIDDEVSCYEGGTAMVDAEGLLDENTEDMSEDELRHHLDRKARAKAIHALWSDHAGPAWTYNTEIRCETFEMLDDGEAYCIGLVFSLSALSQSISDTAVASEVEAMLAELPAGAAEMRSYFETLARAGFSRCATSSEPGEGVVTSSCEPAPVQDGITLPRQIIQAVVDRLATVETGAMAATSAPSVSELRQLLAGTLSAQPGAEPLPAEGGLSLPQELLPTTRALVVGFANALGDKLAGAQRKYGYGDSWADPHWMPECHQAMAEHLAKGDPRDVAAYCAFLWHHGESTAKVVQALYQQSSEIAASRRLQAAAAELLSACRAASCLNNGDTSASLKPQARE